VACSGGTAAALGVDVAVAVSDFAVPSFVPVAGVVAVDDAAFPAGAVVVEAAGAGLAGDGDCFVSVVVDGGDDAPAFAAGVATDFAGSLLSVEAFGADFSVVGADVDLVTGSLDSEVDFEGSAFSEVVLEPIQEDLIQEHWVERVRRLSMMRIMARRTKAATVLV
jgi:hypothetical protein